MLHTYGLGLTHLRNPAHALPFNNHDPAYAKLAAIHDHWFERPASKYAVARLRWRRLIKSSFNNCGHTRMVALRSAYDRVPVMQPHRATVKIVF